MLFGVSSLTFIILKNDTVPNVVVCLQFGLVIAKYFQKKL